MLENMSLLTLSDTKNQNINMRGSVEFVTSGLRKYLRKSGVEKMG